MPEIADPETPVTHAAPIDYNQMGAAIATHVRPLLAQQQPPQVISEYEQVKRQMMAAGTLDETNAKGIDALLEARIRDKERADEGRRAQQDAERAQKDQKRAVDQRSESTIIEIDKLISRFGADNALVNKSKLSIRDNVIKAFDADASLVKRYQAGDIDYGAIEKFVIKEVNEYMPEGRKSAGGPAIKNDKPGETKAVNQVDLEALDEKSREFVTAQVNFWKKQPGYEDLSKAKEKAVEMFSAAEEKRKSKK